jgi:cytochrome c peroxidase
MMIRIPLACLAFLAVLGASRALARDGSHLDTRLRQVLSDNGFTGTIGQPETLEDRLGRPLNTDLADLGNLLFFDKVLGLHEDHSCAGCHAPTNGFGDTQSISIGIQSNENVGPDRVGPRNLRRAPMMINSAFYPKLMWDGRFSATSGNPFDNSDGFEFPEPEGTTEFPPRDPVVTHLLIAQAFIPPTQFEEMAGFTGTTGTLDPAFDEFDDLDEGLLDALPAADASGYRNEPIRQAVLEKLNDNDTYPGLFAKSFPKVRAGNPIDFTMVGRAIAEFEFSQICADAPLDKYARGTDNTLLTDAEKRGALIFFGKGQCVSCHAVAGESNEMFSDFKTHVIAAPQIAPVFGKETGNVLFDGDDGTEDYGHERVTGDEADRYMFRTAPLRNLAVAPAFFHDGAVLTVEAAIRHHLNVEESLSDYDAEDVYDPADDVYLDTDLTFRRGPYPPMIARLDETLKEGIDLTEREISDLVEFVGVALTDEDCVEAKVLCDLVPPSTPGNDDMEHFFACAALERDDTGLE